jgi:hypothetical protein
MPDYAPAGSIRRERAPMSSDRIHLSVDEARDLGERALRGIGYNDEDSRISPIT